MNNSTGCSFSVSKFTALLCLILSVGVSTTTAAQSVADRPTSQVFPGAEPIVPPITTKALGDTFESIVVPLDGLECTNCVFRDTVLTYAGGTARLINPRFEGKVSIEFKGPAKNAIDLYRSAKGGPPSPRRPDPKANPKVPIARTIKSVDLILDATNE